MRKPVLRVTVVVTSDGLVDYFLVINRATGEEIIRKSSMDFDMFKFENFYNNRTMVDRIIEEIDATEYNIIYF